MKRCSEHKRETTIRWKKETEIKDDGGKDKMEGRKRIKIQEDEQRTILTGEKYFSTRKRKTLLQPDRNDLKRCSE